jgi:hypothetical protein
LSDLKCAKFNKINYFQDFTRHLKIEAISKLSLLDVNNFIISALFNVLLWIKKASYFYNW